MIGIDLTVTDRAQAARTLDDLLHAERRLLHHRVPSTALAELIDALEQAHESALACVQFSRAFGDGPAMLSVGEVSAEEGCHPSTVRRRAENGRYPGALAPAPGVRRDWLIPARLFFPRRNPYAR